MSSIASSGHKILDLPNVVSKVLTDPNPVPDLFGQSMVAAGPRIYGLHRIERGFRSSPAPGERSARAEPFWMVAEAALDRRFERDRDPTSA
jgi:hypothetical protein